MGTPYCFCAAGLRQNPRLRFHSSLKPFIKPRNTLGAWEQPPTKKVYAHSWTNLAQTNVIRFGGYTSEQKAPSHADCFHQETLPPWDLAQRSKASYAPVAHEHWPAAHSTSSNEHSFHTEYFRSGENHQEKPAPPLHPSLVLCGVDVSHGQLA